MNENEAQAFLSQSKVGVVASLRSDGYPQSTPVWYRYDGEAIIIWTDKNRQWVKNMMRDDRVSFSIQDDAPPFAALTLRGKAELVDQLNDSGLKEAKNAESIIDVLVRTMDLFLTEVGHNDFHGAVRVNALLRMAQNALDTGQISENQLFRGIPVKMKKWIKERRAVPMIFVGPKQHMNHSSLDFESEKMKFMMKMGRERAQVLLPKWFDALSNGAVV